MLKTRLVWSDQLENKFKIAVCVIKIFLRSWTVDFYFKVSASRGRHFSVSVIVSNIHWKMKKAIIFEKFNVYTFSTSHSFQHLLKIFIVFPIIYSKWPWFGKLKKVHYWLLCCFTRDCHMSFDYFLLFFKSFSL